MIPRRPWRRRARPPLRPTRIAPCRALSDADFAAAEALLADLAAALAPLRAADGGPLAGLDRRPCAGARARSPRRRRSARRSATCSTNGRSPPARASPAASPITPTCSRRWSPSARRRARAAIPAWRCSACWRRGCCDFDRVVLAGLDETVWPPAARTDAFLNRQMRADLGLSPPERRIGQTAQDFVAALGGGDAVLDAREEARRLADRRLALPAPHRGAGGRGDRAALRARGRALSRPGRAALDRAAAGAARGAPGAGAAGGAAAAAGSASPASRRCAATPTRSTPSASCGSRRCRRSAPTLTRRGARRRLAHGCWRLSPGTADRGRRARLAGARRGRVRAAQRRPGLSRVALAAHRRGAGHVLRRSTPSGARARRAHLDRGRGQARACRSPTARRSR